MRILIAEDEDITLKHTLYALKKAGYEAIGVGDGLEAVEKLKASAYDLLITDLKMPGMDGLSLLGEVSQKYPDMPVMIVTGFGSIDSAVEAMKRGAEDYLTKPFNLDELVLKVGRILQKKSIENENTALKLTLEVGTDIPFIAKSRAMKSIANTIEAIANSDCNVFITGESGVGKGLVAKLIHYTSMRKAKPFVAVNCALFTEELLASELFGHEKGAFTGAVKPKRGLLEIAHGGTMFLDEIGEMAVSLQAKLLKVVEEREFMRVGGTSCISSDVRFIAATNQNITTVLSEGKFREDLYYRLNVMDIYIPPLRERKDDIVPLCKYLLQKHSKKNKKAFAKGFTDEALELLKSYSFPGNVRELENIIERAVILEQSAQITTEHFPQAIKMFQIETIEPGKVKSIDELNQDYARMVLEHVNNNKTKAAEMLGISRTNLWRMLKK